MNRFLTFLLLAASLAATLVSPAQAAKALTPDDVLTKLKNNFSIIGRYADVSMNVVRDNRDEMIHFEVFSADEAHLRLEVSTPPRMKGMAIIRNTKDLWIHMPRIDSIRHYAVKNSKQNSDQTIFGSDLRMSDLFNGFDKFSSKIERRELGSAEMNMVLTDPAGLLRYTMQLDTDNLPKIVTVEELVGGDKFLAVRRLTVLSWIGTGDKRHPTKLLIEDLKNTKNSTSVEILYWAGGRSFPEDLFAAPRSNASRQ